MLEETRLPFNPLRRSLYTPWELFDGFSPEDATSYATCPDIQTLSYFVKHGKHPARDNGASTLEALHDNCVSQATQDLLRDHSRVVAVMGGHQMVRGTPPYVDVAHLAWELANAGFLLASGGGPGAMEATHLGALFSSHPATELEDAIKQMSAEAALPMDARDLVGADGQINADVAARLHRWIRPAFLLARAISNIPGGCTSLAVPTWLYGYEPTTPFATHIAKYFQNSLREDGLVTLAKQGIVYSEGSAGTVQEIFQDTAQNYYDTLCPMVFLSAPGGNYWADKLPVQPLVEALLGRKPEFQARVLFTSSMSSAVRFLRDTASP
jgi:predicted Rossmann-fold nucleotide-binding protein